MRLILTAGLLSAALILAALSAVHAQSLNEPPTDTTTPVVLVGE